MRTQPIRATEDEDTAERTRGAVSDGEFYDIFRVSCPDCGQPIAVLAHEEELPPHALCPTPWDPFGLTVCQGSGRRVADAPPADDAGHTQEDAAALLTLPEGLDWRTQPFSHIGGPSSRPMVRMAARQG
ncbi:hypothetical protein [Streptomyces sp. AJS327]|uniref:hypothetical protein n=1 Tax=Streptomyces sp. AJS327 TaxID=2545265 RepID=UPI002155BE76|nr:hypothetical protein [Streptomyces sp. AJS327]